jgi:hypothetical protein
MEEHEDVHCSCRLDVSFAAARAMLWQYSLGLMLLEPALTAGGEHTHARTVCFIVDAAVAEVAT